MNNFAFRADTPKADATVTSRAHTCKFNAVFGDRPRQPAYTSIATFRPDTPEDEAASSSRMYNGKYNVTFEDRYHQGTSIDSCRLDSVENDAKPNLRMISSTTIAALREKHRLLNFMGTSSYRPESPKDDAEQFSGIRNSRPNAAVGERQPKNEIASIPSIPPDIGQRPHMTTPLSLNTPPNQETPVQGPPVWHLDKTRFSVCKVPPSMPYLVLGHGQDLSARNFPLVCNQLQRRGTPTTSESSSPRSSFSCSSSQAPYSQTATHGQRPSLPPPLRPRFGADSFYQSSKPSRFAFDWFRPKGVHHSSSNEKHTDSQITSRMEAGASVSTEPQGTQSGSLKKTTSAPPHVVVPIDAPLQTYLNCSLQPKMSQQQSSSTTQGRHIQENPITTYVPDSFCFTENIPWCEDAFHINTFQNWVQISMPPYTQDIGYSTGADAFTRNTVKVLQFSKRYSVFVPGEQFGKVHIGVMGLIFPTVCESSSRVVCREIFSHAHPRPDDHFLSAGISLAQECDVVKDEESSPVSSQSAKFMLISSHHRVQYIDQSRVTLHKPYRLSSIPCILSKVTNGIPVRVRIMPIIFLLFAAFVLAIPGIIQKYTGTDQAIGDIVNQVIGTGSVLLGVVVFIFRQMFGPIFSWNTIRGRFDVSNYYAARIFASDILRKIEEHACDPRIAPDLIKNYKNSAVRARRNGWLKVGQSIQIGQMKKHGYYVHRSRGLVLDKLNAIFYTCSRKGRKVSINRKPAESICSKIKKTYIFE